MTAGLERTFAALPPPAAGRSFARTWWGKRWLAALEDTALDAGQLRQGRRYARRGAVGAVSVRPGRLTAVVGDDDGSAYRADVLLPQLAGDDWDRLLEVAAREAGHIAALLDRELPPHLAQDAAAAGVELLPGIGDLEPACGCEAWDHCPHTAALCYQLARLLDEDPFVLLLLRGRDERALLDGLQARSAAHATCGAPQEAPAAQQRGAAGMDAAAAYARVPPALPGPPPEPAAPGRAHVPTGAGPPDPAEVDVPALEFLATAAAGRAHRMLAEALSPDHGSRRPARPLTERQDAVRLAAAGPPRHVARRLALGTSRTPSQLASAVRAWEYGGAAALEVLETRWVPGGGELARARHRLATAWAEEESRPVLRADGNRWTVTGAGAQLRYGRDGRWWPYREERGGWWPAGPAEQDPAAALATALGGRPAC